MQPDEFQSNESDPKYAALNDTEISALIKASTVSAFTPSEKVKQAPINFQKKTLSELAKLSNDEVVQNEPVEQSASAGLSEFELNDDNHIAEGSRENVAEIDEPEIDGSNSGIEVNPILDAQETEAHAELHEKLKNQVSELEAHIMRLETELAELSTRATATEDDAKLLRHLLTQLPALALQEEERFSQKVLSTIEDVIRTRLGVEISDRPEIFVSKIKEQIKDLYVDGSHILIMINSEDFAAIERILQDSGLEQHMQFQVSEDLGRGDLIIKAGSIEINDSLQVGLVETKPENHRD
jgi:flagellar biosynthesis/type III secretory pathway protein FliH